MAAPLLLRAALARPRGAPMGECPPAPSPPAPRPAAPLRPDTASPFSPQLSSRGACSAAPPCWRPPSPGAPRPGAATAPPSRATVRPARGAACRGWVGAGVSSRPGGAGHRVRQPLLARARSGRCGPARGCSSALAEGGGAAGEPGGVEGQRRGAGGGRKRQVSRGEAGWLLAPQCVSVASERAAAASCGHGWCQRVAEPPWWDRAVRSAGRVGLRSAGVGMGLYRTWAGT